jgi:hypothetical protein
LGYRKPVLALETFLIYAVLQLEKLQKISMGSDSTTSMTVGKGGIVLKRHAKLKTSTTDGAYSVTMEG